MSELDPEEFQSFGPRNAADLLGHEEAEQSLLAAWGSGPATLARSHTRQVPILLLPQANSCSTVGQSLVQEAGD